ncbi:MAG TPA: four helix bundle protein [Patescibacteria group bacterium]|nr:four helix bundle protein [Patescibacteria group bacterium]
MEDKKVKSFIDLNAWKEGHNLVVLLFKELKTFPREVFFLKDQMGRCVVSITSNIAEGFSRKSRKEKVQFYYMSLGSTTELQNQLLIAKDLGYMTPEKFRILAEKTVIVHKLLNGLIKSAEDIHIHNT